MPTTDGKSRYIRLFILCTLDRPLDRRESIQLFLKIQRQQSNSHVLALLEDSLYQINRELTRKNILCEEIVSSLIEGTLEGHS